jgi:hypothetical protein
MDAEIEAHRTDADWCKRMVRGSGHSYRRVSDDAGYLECRGLAPSPTLAQALSREVDVALREQDLVGTLALESPYVPAALLQD